MATFSHPPSEASPGTKAAMQHPSFGEAFRFWLKLGFIGFGGPAGQIAIMQTELVEKKRWISQSRFSHALNFCMILPGPEAQQLAIYIGWLLHRTAGGIVAGSLFVLPSMFILWGLSFFYAAYGNVLWVAAIFYGLRPAVVAIVAAAVIRIGKKTLKNEVMLSIAATAFACIFFFKLPFPLIIFTAALIGLVGGSFWKGTYDVMQSDGGKTEASVLDNGDESPLHCRPSWPRALKVTAVGLALWWTPVIMVGFWRGWNSTLFKEGLFFSKAAVVTFGGAYAVLPYVAQQAVENFGWLKAGQMMDGLAFAETTPGPLIMVLQFVGFMGGWNQGVGMSPLASGTLGALLTTWVTFTPCFLWIFLGGPHIEQLRGNGKLATALSATSAAVVGVILSLAVGLGLHVIFPQRVDIFALMVAVVALLGLVRWRWTVIPVIFAAGLAGLLFKMLF